MAKRWLAIREKSVPVLRRSLIVSLSLTAIVVAGYLLKPWFWPGGLGFDKGETVTTERVEKDAKGILVKTTTKGDDGKTLWDWLSLLGVPLSLAILGYWLQKNQQKRAEKVAEEQRERDQKFAQENRERDQKFALELRASEERNAQVQRERDEKLAKEQRDIAANETKEEVLQVYFDRLSALLIDKNLLAIASKVYATETQENEGQPKIAAMLEERELLDSAVDVIRARTLSILRRFENDPERKSSVIRFLIETDVVSRLKVNLSEADLSNAILIKAKLNGVNLSGALLYEADLRKAFLNEADMRGANLSRSDLRGTFLRDAKLNGINLSDANLSGAFLNGADLRGVDFSRVNLSEAHLYETRFNSNAAFSDTEKTDLKARGAIFEDPL